jgi:hypothetical protein
VPPCCRHSRCHSRRAVCHAFCFKDVLSAKRYLSERGGEILNSAAIVPLASSSCHIVLYKMTYRAILLKILILFLLYSDWIFTLAGHQSPMVPWFGLEMGLGSSCHSGSRLAGEYCIILLSNEPFDGHICLLECTLVANCYSLMPHTIYSLSQMWHAEAHIAR